MEHATDKTLEWNSRRPNGTLFGQLESWSVRTVDPHGNQVEGYDTLCLRPPHTPTAALFLASPFHVEMCSIVLLCVWIERLGPWRSAWGDIDSSAWGGDVFLKRRVSGSGSGKDSRGAPIIERTVKVMARRAETRTLFTCLMIYPALKRLLKCVSGPGGK